MIRRTLSRALICLALLLAFAAYAPPAVGQQVEVKTASALCAASGNQYDEVRFNLSTPATVGVQFDAADANWWLRQEPTGPMLAQVLKGEVIIPSGASTGGGTLKSLSVSLPAGTFLLHCDCAGKSADRSSAAILTVPSSPPTPSGPSYLAVARADAGPVTEPGWAHGYNDRVFIITSRQVVSWHPNPYTDPGSVSVSKPNGWIADANRVTWWAIDKGTVRSRSTMDLPAGVYCLHTDYSGDMSVSISDQWSLQFVGPVQPGGEKTTVTATYNPNPMGNESKYDDAAFVLTQPQVVTVGGDSGIGSWIVDSTGLLWYRTTDGVIQSGSAWVDSTPGKSPGEPASAEGLMLAAGTYLVHADAGGAGSSKTKVTVTFVGAAADAFAWPSPMRYICKESNAGGQPAAGATAAQDADDDTVECKWSDVPCQIEAARAAIERRVQAWLERLIAEWLQEMCASSYLAPVTAVGVVLLSRRRKRG